MLLLSLICDIGDMLHDMGELDEWPNIPMLPSVFIDDTDDADGDGTMPVPNNKQSIYILDYNRRKCGK